MKFRKKVSTPPKGQNFFGELSTFSVLEGVETFFPKIFILSIIPRGKFWVEPQSKKGGFNPKTYLFWTPSLKK